MSVKLNHYYSIIPEKTDGYEKFIIDEFIPGTSELGLNTVAGWSVLIGAYSDIIFETVADGLDSLEKALRDEKYRDLNTRLLGYVRGYKTKVLTGTGKIDAYTTEFPEHSVKFNQTWEIIGEKKEAYDTLTSQEFYPCLEDLGITVAGEWEVLIGDGPHIICEGRVNDIKTLIGSLQSKKFQTAKRKLKGFVENYQSRILSFHIRKGESGAYTLM